MPADALSRIRNQGFEILICDVSLFEVLAKGAKLVSVGAADPERVTLAIKSILTDRSVEKVSPYAEDIMIVAVELRRHHSDFVDCMILASAAVRGDVLVSEEASLQRNDDLMKLVLRRKPKFRIMTLKALLAERR